MRKVTKLSAVVGTMAVLGLAVPATAEPTEPQIVDAAGDANFLNTQGSTSVEPASGPDTRPASLDGADIVSIRFHTRYSTAKLRNTDGTVQSVDYRPSALQVDITMAGDVKPTDGPSLLFRVQAMLGTCETWFQGWVRGSQGQPTEPERADIRKLTATCPGGANTVTNGFTYTIDGNVITMTYPFQAAAFSGAMAGFIKDGTEITAPTSFLNNANYPHVRASVNGGTLTAPTIDQTARMTDFTVGSDVPADVVCAKAPTNPDCA
jgi:hypothetical protein